MAKDPKMNERLSVRRRTGHRGRVSVLAASVVCSAAFLSACGEENATGGESLLLRPNGDLLAAGGSRAALESVTGDAMLVGGSVEYSGDVGGSYLGAGGQQEIRGTMAGSGRVVGGTILFGASVGRNVTLAGVASSSCRGLSSIGMRIWQATSFASEAPSTEICMPAPARWCWTVRSMET